MNAPGNAFISFCFNKGQTSRKRAKKTRILSSCKRKVQWLITTYDYVTILGVFYEKSPQRIYLLKENFNTLKFLNI